MAKKERLDVLLVDKELVGSREKAKKLIMAGLVMVDGQREDKAGTRIDITKEITLKKDPNPYVSRGGLKLHKAIHTYSIDLDKKICMDVGASTGGFTDCMLKHGGKKVYSVDVGYGQFDWGLRQDERVVCLEKTNVRYITSEKVPDPLDFVSIDVSFISLGKVLPAVVSLMKETSEIVCLIKPQFEAGREKVGKKGVVRDPSVHEEVIANIVQVFEKMSLRPIAINYSPITGPEGNIEYLIYGSKGKEVTDVDPIDIKTIVNNAHRDLYRK